MTKAIKDLLLLSVFCIISLHAFIPHTHAPLPSAKAEFFNKKGHAKSLIGLFKLMFQDKSEDSLDSLAFSNQQVEREHFLLQMTVAVTYGLLLQDELENHTSSAPPIYDDIRDNRLIIDSDGVRGPPNTFLNT